MTERAEERPARSAPRRWAPYAVGAALTIAGAVEGALQIAHQHAHEPFFADELAPSGPVGLGPLFVGRRLIAAAILVGLGAVVLSATVAWRSAKRARPASGSPSAGPGWRSPWVAGLGIGLAGVVGGIVLLATAPEPPSSFGWFAYAPLSSPTAQSGAFESSMTLHSYRATPVTDHLLIGALVLLLGLVVGTAAGARGLRLRRG